MDSKSDEEIPNAHPEIQITEQGDAPEEPSSLNRSRFRVVVEEGALAAVSPRESSFFEWSIVTDPMEIDDSEDGSGDATPEDALGAEENREPESMDNKDEANGPDQIDNLEESGRNLDNEETQRSLPPQINLAHVNILKRYEYTTFNPTPVNRNSPGTAPYMPHPTQPDVLAAIKDLKKILHPRHDAGQGYKDPEIDLWSCARLEGMMSMFQMFTNPQSRTYNEWGASACQTAIGMG